MNYTIEDVNSFVLTEEDCKAFKSEFEKKELEYAKVGKIISAHKYYKLRQMCDLALYQLYNNEEHQMIKKRR